MAAEYVRVKDRDTGHELSIRTNRVNEDAHEVLDKDPLGRDGLPRPVKYRVPLGDQPAPSATTGTKPRTTTHSIPEALQGEDGHPAETEEEI